MNKTIVESLFKTQAFKVAPQGELFWYTSGKLGPFYINTHFLYGSQTEAEALLAKIDALSSDKTALCDMLVIETAAQYKNNAVFRGVCDFLCATINEKTKGTQYDYISGGERRDWFFSVVCAALLGKPHLTLYKDMSSSLIIDGKYADTPDLSGARCVHIADLITEASSYERAWIPAIKKSGGEMPLTAVVVDRCQGGAELLRSLGTEAFSLSGIDEGMFALAAEQKLITPAQHDMLVSYMSDPTESVRAFLCANPDFMKKALSGDEKTAKRAKLCEEKGFYKL